MIDMCFPTAVLQLSFAGVIFNIQDLNALLANSVFKHKIAMNGRYLTS
jgi:hypothetical protein